MVPHQKRTLEPRLDASRCPLHKRGRTCRSSSTSWTAWRSQQTNDRRSVPGRWRCSKVVRAMLARSGMFRCLSINLFLFCSIWELYLVVVQATTNLPKHPFLCQNLIGTPVLFFFFVCVPLRKICPKIEKPQALTNIEGIIEKSQALMVARPWDEGPGAQSWQLQSGFGFYLNDWWWNLLGILHLLQTDRWVSNMFLFPMVFGIMMLKQ